MKKMMGSYEALFSRRALKYKELGLKDKKAGRKRFSKIHFGRVYFFKTTGSDH